MASLEAFASSFAPQIKNEARDVLLGYLKQADAGQPIVDDWHTLTHAGYEKPCDQAYWAARLYGVHKSLKLPVPSRVDQKLYQLTRLVARGVDGAEDAITYLGAEYEPPIACTDDEMASALAFAHAYASDRASTQSPDSDGIPKGHRNPACWVYGAMLALGDKSMIQFANQQGVYCETMEIALTYRTLIGRGGIPR